MKQHIRRYAAIVAGLAGSLAVFSATTPAFATLIPDSGSGYDPASAPATVHTVVVSGTPGWQTAMIALGSAVIAAAAAILAYRARQRRLAVVAA